MKLIVASDQAGLPLKQAVLQHLAARGITAVDAGPATAEEAVDYPDAAEQVGRTVSAGGYDRGILICGTGLGMSIAANRLRGVRAALCYDVYSAHMGRAHNDANVLCMGAWVVTPQRAEGIVNEFLRTEYEAARHVPRLVKVDELAENDENPLKTADERVIQPFFFTVSLSPNVSVFGPLLFAGRLKQGIRAAAEARFDAVELSLRSPDDIELDQIQAWTRERELWVSAIATGQSYLHDGLSFCNPDPQIREACVERLKSLVPVAAQLNAAMILGGIRGKFTGDPATWAKQRTDAVESMRELVKYAARLGVSTLIEPINRYETNFINTAAEGLAVLDELGEPSTKLLLDAFHMNIEEVDIPRALREAGGRLGYVHVADSNRYAPGQGHTPFHRIFKTLEAIDYRGFVGAEILPRPDDQTALSEAGRFFQSLFDATDSNRNETSPGQ